MNSSLDPLGAEEAAAVPVLQKSATGTTRLHVVRADTSEKRKAAQRFARADRATITRDPALDGWRLEIWGEGPTALGLWSIAHLDDLSEAGHAEVALLLANIGLADEGTSSWTLVDGRWESPLHAVRES